MFLIRESICFVSHLKTLGLSQKIHEVVSGPEEIVDASGLDLSDHDLQDSLAGGGTECHGHQLIKEGNFIYVVQN